MVYENTMWFAMLFYYNPNSITSIYLYHAEKRQTIQRTREVLDLNTETEFEYETLSTPEPKIVISMKVYIEMASLRFENKISIWL